jgi:hypothetical protein
MFTIYQLVDPRDNQPRYVGCTEDFERRRLDYLNGPPHSKALRRWFSELNSLNLSPLMIPLESLEGTIEDALKRELYWIRRLIAGGAVLLNAQGNSAKQERKKTTILLTPERALWLKIRSIDERREMSEIVDDALALYERLYSEDEE